MSGRPLRARTRRSLKVSFWTHTGSLDEGIPSRFDPSPDRAAALFRVAEAAGFAYTDVQDSLEDVLMASARLLAACFLVLFTTPLFASDPHPSQLYVSFLAQPAPIVQDGSTRLVYEMVITNFSNDKYVLDAVEAKAGTAQFTFSGSALAGMII